MATPIPAAFQEIATLRSSQGKKALGRTRLICTILLVLFASLVIAQAAQGQSEWTRQFGSANGDGAAGVAVSASGVYVLGHTSGTLPGNVTGSGFAFLRKYDFSGNEVWTRQFGDVFVTSVVADSAGVYVAGRALITLPGQTGAGLQDAFVRKYDADGNEVWTRQFGTVQDDQANGVAVDATGVYVGGSSGAGFAFLRKFDSDGNLLWTQFIFISQSHTRVWALAADGSSVYIAGAVSDEAFVRKYDTNGIEVWTQPFGTPAEDTALGVALDSSGVYVAGYTLGALAGASAGNYDVFVRKYDHDGNEVWTRQFGTAGFDFAAGIAAHGSAVYVGGSKDGAAFGVPTVSDGFVRKYDADGNEVWTRALSTEEEDFVTGVAANETGVFAAGATSGVLPGQTSAGGRDAFVTRMNHLSAAQLIQQLVAQVVALNLRQGITNSFDAKLQTVLNALEDANQNNNASAVNLLQAFINGVEAQRGRELTSEQADALIASALEIISVLCG